jgi:hypothetical protein
VLGHHNLSSMIAWSVDQIRTTFVDNIGNKPKVGTGTGFWVNANDGPMVFVTNRHNVDPSIIFPKEKSLRLTKVELSLRVGPGNVLLYAPGEWFQCENVEDSLYMSREWDVAIFVAPRLLDCDPERYRPRPVIKETDLADREWFQRTQTMMDDCYFIGYPGTPAALSKSGRDVFHYDTRSKFPIARHAIIASPPDIPFSHDSIPTTGTVLVSGMSFHGSSGSPVVTPQMGVPHGIMDFQVGNQKEESFRPARVIGIMTGKFSTNEIGADFTHAGLSYFTLSSCIAWVIQKAREADWKRPSPELGINNGDQKSR